MILTHDKTDLILLHNTIISLFTHQNVPSR